MNHTILLENLERLHEHVCKLEQRFEATHLGVGNARKQDRNKENYYSEHLQHYVNDFMAEGANSQEKARSLLEAVKSVYRSLKETGDWPRKVGKLIFRNLHSINIYEFRDMVSTHNHILSMHAREQIKAVIDNIAAGNGTQYK